MPMIIKNDKDDIWEKTSVGCLERLNAQVNFYRLSKAMPELFLHREDELNGEFWDCEDDDWTDDGCCDYYDMEDF